MDRRGEALQQAHDLVAEVVKQSANEPSRGLYFVQQHVHRAVPAIVSLKSQIVDRTEEVMLNTEDARDAIAAVKCMKAVGPPVIDRILKLVSSSSSRLQPPSHSKGQLVQSVTDLAKLLPGNHMKGIWDTATGRSSSTDVEQEQSGNAILSAESSESPSGYVRSVLDSAIQRAGTLVSGSEPSTSGFLDAVHTRSGRYVWAVLDSALGRKEATEEAPAASEGQEEQQQKVLDSIPDEEMFDKFQAESAAKLEEWLGES